MVLHPMIQNILNKFQDEVFKKFISLLLMEKLINFFIFNFFIQVSSVCLTAFEAIPILYFLENVSNIS